MKKVIIITTKNYYNMKYVVIQTSDGIVLRASEKAERHRELVEAFNNEGNGRCIGGGMLEIDHGAKKIRAYLFSADYGEDRDRTRTVALLKEEYPEYEVTGEMPRKKINLSSLE